MRIAQVQFSPWDKIYSFKAEDASVVDGAMVIVDTEFGLEIGKVIGIFELSDDGKMECECPNKSKSCCANKPVIETGKEIKSVVRNADKSDLEKLPKESEKQEALIACKKMAEKYDLPMKIVDVHFSYDGSRMTFAFISDGRVDFRELVKDLTRHFKRNIRLHQIGIRDEAKIMGDCGHCGRKLCCRGFLDDLTSITSEMADVQQCGHRGSDRLSGVCGRLMCCLAYEEKGYEDMTKNMPPIGAKVSVDGKRGVVVGHHVLKQSVDVEFAEEKGEGKIRVEVDLNRNKK